MVLRRAVTVPLPVLVAIKTLTLYCLVWSTLRRAKIRAYGDALLHYSGGPAETEDMHTEVEPREAEVEKLSAAAVRRQVAATEFHAGGSRRGTTETWGPGATNESFQRRTTAAAQMRA